MKKAICFIIQFVGTYVITSTILKIAVPPATEKLLAYNERRTTERDSKAYDERVKKAMARLASA